MVPAHNASFDIDEDALAIGWLILAEHALRLLVCLPD